MISIIILWLLAPVTIYLGLITFKSVLITFIAFYGIVCITIPIVDHMMIRRRTIRQYLIELGFINFKQTALPALLLGAFFCLFILGFFVVLQKYVLNIEQAQSVLNQWNIDKKYVLSFMFMMIFTNSVCEELYWRGYIFKKLKNKYSPFSSHTFNFIVLCVLPSYNNNQFVSHSIWHIVHNYYFWDWSVLGIYETQI